MLKDFYQQLVELAERFHPPVIHLHELLNSQFVSVHNIPQLSQLFLMIEQKPILGASGHGMQRKSDLAQKLFAVSQLIKFSAAQEIGLVNVVQSHIKTSERDPFDDLQVSQATGGAFDVGLECVFCVAVFVMAALLLPEFPPNELVGGPHIGGVCGAFQRSLECGIPGNQPRFHHGGDDCEILSSQRRVLLKRPHAVPDLQPNIPQHRNKTLEFEGDCVGGRRCCKDQYVDVGVRKELSTPISADRDQGNVGRVAHLRFPQVIERRIDRVTGISQKRANGFAGVKCGRQCRAGRT